MERQVCRTLETWMMPCNDKLKLGQSNRDSVYYRSWQDIQPFSSSKYSNAFWTGSGTTRSMTVNVLKCRCRQLWNKKLAFIRNMPYFSGQPPAKDMKCPLCGQPDSVGHMLGHCQHKDMAGSYIARHDEAMRKVIKATLKGQQGSKYIIADVGRLPELQKLGVHSKRIPAFVLPSWLLLRHQVCGQIT